MNAPEVAADPFTHLKQRAAERADRTVERLRAGIATLRASEHKITAESLKRVTRELEPGFAGLRRTELSGDPQKSARLRAVPRGRQRLQRASDTTTSRAGNDDALDQAHAERHARR